MQLPRKIASSTSVAFACEQCGKMIKSDYLQQGDNTVCPFCSFEQAVPLTAPVAAQNHQNEAPLNLPPGASHYVNQGGGFGAGDDGVYGGGGLGRSGFQGAVSSELAGRGERLAAALIDGIAAVFLLYGLPLLGAGFGFAFFLLLCFAGVQIYLLTTSGQTVGKRAMNIRIVKFDDESEGGFVHNVLLRGIVNGIIGIIPLYGLVDVLFIFRDDQRCIHDLIASTKVVKA